MAQIVILQGCDLERSRSSVKVKTFSIRPPPPTHKYTCDVSLKFYASLSITVFQSLTERWPGKERMKEGR